MSERGCDHGMSHYDDRNNNERGDKRGEKIYKHIEKSDLPPLATAR